MAPRKSALMVPLASPEMARAPAMEKARLSNLDAQGSQNLNLAKQNFAKREESLRLSVCTPAPSQSTLQKKGLLPPVANEPVRSPLLGDAKTERPLIAPQIGKRKQETSAMSAARRLRSLADPEARLAFLQIHPFFEDTSQSLRERLAPQLVRRSCEEKSGKVVVLEQGAEPAGNEGMDYLFLTPPDVHTSIEVTFDGKAITVLGGNSIFGQEVIFGVTQRFVFGTRIITGSLASLWVVPRSVVQGLLQRDSFRDDAKILKQRAHDTISTIFRTWYTMPMTNLHIKLFEACDHAFKQAFVEELEYQVVAGGTALVREGQEQDWAFCVWRGEAEVRQGGSSIAQLSHLPKASAWAAWWGILELLGVSSTCVHDVTAVTDCILWRLNPDALKSLRKQYPLEMRLFEKVAYEHASMLQPKALSLQKASFFEGADETFMEELAAATERRLVKQAEVICTKDEEQPARVLFLIARGSCSVRKTGIAGRRGSLTGMKAPDLLGGGSMTAMGPGDVFGEMVALGLKQTWPSQIVADSICDLHCIPGQKLHELLVKYPFEAQRFHDLLEARDSNKYHVKDLKDLKAFEHFSKGFCDKLFPFCKRKAFFPGMQLQEEKRNVNEMFILLQGVCSVESNGKAGTANIKAPMVFGVKAALESRHPGKHTVRAVEYCSCLAIQASNIFKLMQDIAEDDIDNDNMEALAFDEDSEIKGAMSGVKIEGKKSNAKIRGTLLNNMEQNHLEIDEEEEKIISETLAKKFEGAQEEFLELVRGGLEKNTYADDEIILKQGDEGDFAILLASGHGIVEVNGTKVGEVQAGSLIGEAVLIGKALSRTATVKSVGEVTGFSIQRRYMHVLFEDFPEERTRMETLSALRTQTNKVLVGDPEDEEKKTKAKLNFKKAAGAALLGSVKGMAGPNPKGRARRASAAGDEIAGKAGRRRSTGSINLGEQDALQEMSSKKGVNFAGVPAVSFSGGGNFRKTMVRVEVNSDSDDDEEEAKKKMKKQAARRSSHTAASVLLLGKLKGGRGHGHGSASKAHSRAASRVVSRPASPGGHGHRKSGASRPASPGGHGHRKSALSRPASPGEDGHRKERSKSLPASRPLSAAKKSILKNVPLDLDDPLEDRKTSSLKPSSRAQNPAREPETLPDEEEPASLLVDERDTDILAQALRRLSGDPLGDMSGINMVRRESLFKFQEGMILNPYEEDGAGKDGSGLSQDSLEEPVLERQISDGSGGAFSDVETGSKGSKDTELMQSSGKAAERQISAGSESDFLHAETVSKGSKERQISGGSGRSGSAFSDLETGSKGSKDGLHRQISGETGAKSEPKAMPHIEEAAERPATASVETAPASGLPEILVTKQTQDSMGMQTSPTSSDDKKNMSKLRMSIMVKQAPEPEKEVRRATDSHSEESSEDSDDHSDDETPKAFGQKKPEATDMSQRRGTGLSGAAGKKHAPAPDVKTRRGTGLSGSGGGRRGTGPIGGALASHSPGSTVYQAADGSPEWLKSWVKKLRKMKKNADVRQETNLAMAGRLTPLVPPDRSYLSDNPRVATPNSSTMGSRNSSRMSNNPPPIGLGEESASVMNYFRARSMYRRPIWEELYD